MALCYQFEKSGACKFADDCKFIHTLAAQERNRPAKASPDIRDTRDTRRSSDTAGGTSKPRNDECYDWRNKGTCSRKNCRFVHDVRKKDIGGAPRRRVSYMSIQRAREAVRQRKNAAALALAKSTSGDACYQFIVTGACTFGEKCDYRHDSKRDSGDSQEARQGRVGFQAAKIALEKAQGDACDQWTYLGRCVFSDDCKFEHPGGGDIRAKADRVSACYSFASNGFCSYGDTCKFEHVSSKEIDRLARNSGSGGGAGGTAKGK